jgi:hypothetical protein
MVPVPRSNNDNTEAVDIITYVGVPLAVLGVLPTLYTCLKSLITLRDVRKLLLQNHVTAITRSSLLSGIIELEVPRRSLCPLERDDPDYFKLGNSTSKLRGGSWTQLNFRSLIIGVKSYRLQYHDELCQPQAEVELEKLVAFLLDLGATPDPQGWEDLRSSGLWTPAGTKLMMSPSTDDAVLFVTTSEDSDGILSLGLRWRADWAMRRMQDLPPYWMRVCAPVGFKTEFDEDGEDEQKEKSVVSAEVIRADTEDTLNEDEESDQTHLSPKDAHRMSLPVPQGHKRSFSKNSARSSISMMTFHESVSSSIRIRLGSSGLAEASYEQTPTKKIKIPHLMHSSHGSPVPAPTWFASAATALGADQGSLWAYTIPPAIVSLAQRETVPGAVLVLLNLIAEDAVPAFRTPFDDKMAEHEAWVAQQKRNQRSMEQLRMTPEERTKAFHKNFMDDHLARIEADRRRAVEDERKKEEDLREALVSQRVSTGMVAEACRKWLVGQKKVMEGDGVVDVVASVLWEMVRDPTFANELARMLEMWKEWTEGGGMTKVHFEFVKKDMLYFAYAACVLSLIRDSAGSVAGSVVSDLQDCLRMWRKVRLG